MFLEIIIVVIIVVFVYYLNSRNRKNRSEEFSRFDYGIKAGISIQLGSFKPFFGYNFGLHNISNDNQEKLFNRGFYLNMTLIFGKP